MAVAHGCIGEYLTMNIQWVLNRMVWVYAVIGLVFVLAIDHKHTAQIRGRYLLGVFYNQDLQNFKDGVVYFDFMRQLKPEVPQYLFFMGYSYLQLGDLQKARRYLKRAVTLDPSNVLWKQYLDYTDDQIIGGVRQVVYPSGVIQIPLEFKE